MSSSFKKLVAASVAGLACAGAMVAVAAPAGARGMHGAHAGGPTVLNASLAPSLPTYPSIFGLPPGGAPWALQAGHVHLGASGRLEVNVTGLVLVTTGTNPVPEIAASVFCNGTVAATTAPVPFSTAGDAQIHAMVSLPSPCLVPAVLLQPVIASVVRSAYIAFDGTA
jgi:hypothetical protein